MEDAKIRTNSYYEAMSAAGTHCNECHPLELSLCNPANMWRLATFSWLNPFITKVSGKIPCVVHLQLNVSYRAIKVNCRGATFLRCRALMKQPGSRTGYNSCWLGEKVLVGH